MPTVTIDGTEHEVDADAISLEEGHKIVSDKEIAASYIPKSLIEGDDPDYVHKKTIDKRFKNWIPRDKAATDETIVAQVIKEHGEAFKAEGLEEAKAQWTRTDVEPLKKEKEQLLEKLGTFEDQVVASQIDAAASKAWKDEFATAPEGRRSWAQVNFRNEFAWDADHGYVVAVNAKGEPLPSSNPTQRRPYMDVNERFRLLAEEDAYRPFARPADTITTGNGAQPKGSGGGGSSKKRSEMSNKEKAAYIVEHGQEAYQSLPA